MQIATAETKARLREEVAARLKALTAVARQRGAAAIAARLPQLAVWQQASSVLFYAPLRYELDVWPLLRQALAEGKAAGLPRFDRETGRYQAFQIRDADSEVRKGHHAVREPVPGCAAMPLNRLDLMLVPGIAFDLHGRRLGRGKGFYDQMLAELGGTSCGIAFDEQIVHAVPVERHDRLVNCILTPTRWVAV